MFNPSSWLPRRTPVSRRSWNVAQGEALRNRACTLHPEAQHVLEMDPEEFLALTAPVDDYMRWIEQQYEYHPEKQAKLENRLENDLALDIAWLVVDIARNFRVIRHEGRHRAMAAMRLGINPIPVLVFVKRGRNYVDLDRHPEDRDAIERELFTPQFKGKRDAW